jgi:hypothetical protein
MYTHVSLALLFFCIRHEMCINNITFIYFLFMVSVISLQIPLIRINSCVLSLWNNNSSILAYTSSREASEWRNNFRSANLGYPVIDRIIQMNLTLLHKHLGHTSKYRIRQLASLPYPPSSYRIFLVHLQTTPSFTQSLHSDFGQITFFICRNSHYDKPSVGNYLKFIFHLNEYSIY